MRFRKERYITQIQSDITGKWTFRVRVKGYEKTFSEKDCNDAASAFAYAKRYRDRLLHEGEKIVKGKKVEDVFNESLDLFPVRYETKRKIKCHFNKYIKEKEKDITKIKADDILYDLNSMIETSTDGTIQRVLSIWKKIIKTAIHKDYISKDVTMMIICPKSHRDNYFKVNKVTDRDTIIKMEELISIKMASEYDRKMVPLLIEFLYLTGTRICEALALNKEDCTERIVINKEIGSSLTERMTVRKCKTELSNRILPMTEEIKEVIEKASKITKGDILFGNEKGGYYDSTSLGDRIHKIGKDAGINFNMYSIRHLFATDMVRNRNIDERTRMELMGHSNINTTIDYARSNDDLKKMALGDRGK